MIKIFRITLQGVAIKKMQRQSTEWEKNFDWHIKQATII